MIVPFCQRRRKLTRLEGRSPLGNADALFGTRASAFRYRHVPRPVTARRYPLADIMAVDSSNVSRRADAARSKLASDSKLRYAKDLVEKLYSQ